MILKVIIIDKEKVNYSMSIERKLAAIMFTDIAGYTSQMSTDQDLAFVLLEEKQSKFKPLIKEHNGTLIKEMDDGKKLLNYPIPKAIVEAWERVK